MRFLRSESGQWESPLASRSTTVVLWDIQGSTSRHSNKRCCARGACQAVCLSSRSLICTPQHPSSVHSVKRQVPPCRRLLEC